MTDGEHEPINRWLATTTDEARIQRSYRRISERRRAPPARIAPRVVLAAAAAVGLAFTAWALRPDVEPPPLTRAGGGAMPTELPRALRLSDGSRITLSEGASVRSVANAGAEVAFWQERGTAAFAIPPRGPRRWEVRTPYGVVRVVGTQFTVDVRHGSMEVAVRRGVVEVESEHLERGTRRLRAGDVLVITTEEQHVAEEHVAEASVAPPHAERGVPAPIEPAPIEPPPTERAQAMVPAPDAPAEPRPAEPRPAEPAPLEPTIEALFAEADSARREGRPRDAVAPLRAVMRRRDPRAALAAFTLAALELDTLGEPERAARDYQRAVALGIGPRLEEEALAKSALAWVRAGRSAEARRAAERYLERHPSGRHAADMRAMLSP